MTQNKFNPHTVLQLESSYLGNKVWTFLCIKTISVCNSPDRLLFYSFTEIYWRGCILSILWSKQTILVNYIQSGFAAPLALNIYLALLKIRHFNEHVHVFPVNTYCLTSQSLKVVAKISVSPVHYIHIIIFISDKLTQKQ